MAKPLIAAMTGLSIVPPLYGFSRRGGRRGAADRAALDRLLHVLAGAEGAAGAGEDRDLEVAAVAELTPGLGESGAQLDAERVHALRPVHPDHHDAVAPLGLDDAHRPPVLPLLTVTRRRCRPTRISRQRQRSPPACSRTPRTSSVSPPGLGAARRSDVGVRESRVGERTSVSGPYTSLSTVWASLRC